MQDDNDDLVKAIMLFAKLIARQRELLVRLSEDLAPEEQEQIERELNKIGKSLDFLDEPTRDEG